MVFEAINIFGCAPNFNFFSFFPLFLVTRLFRSSSGGSHRNNNRRVSDFGGNNNSNNTINNRDPTLVVDVREKSEAVAWMLHIPDGSPKAAKRRIAYS